MANDTWIGGTSSDWTVASNWSTGAVPGGGDAVSVPVTASYDPVLTGNVGTVASVSNAATLFFKSGGALAVTGDFANGGGLVFDQISSSGAGGSSLTVGGTLSGAGSLIIGNQTLAKSDTVTVGALAVSAPRQSITLSGGQFNGATGKASLVVNSAAGFGTQGVLSGNVDLTGNALLQFGSGAITSIGSGSSLTLQGPNAFIADAGATGSNSALALSSNAGTFSLGGGAAASTPGALANGGEIDVGDLNAATVLTVNSAPGLGTAGVINGDVRITANGTIAFTQPGQLTSIAVNGSLIISSATPFTAGGTANGVLALASVSSPLAIYGPSLANASSLMALTATGHIALDAGGALTQAGSISSAGSIDIEIGSLTVNGTLSSSGGISVGVNMAPSSHPTLAAGSSALNAGSIALTGGEMQLGSAASVATQSITLSNSALLDLGGPSNSLAGTIAFAGGAAATLRIEASEVPASGGAFANTVAGFGGGDTIDLRSLSYGGAATTASYAGTTLTVTNGSSTDTLTLNSPGGTVFMTASDGKGGTAVTVVCFTTGTRIRVARDGARIDVPVEALAVGDLAVTASGEDRPIRWIGSRAIRCRRHPEPDAVLPVRIRAGAFGEGRPARDLVVSPGHALCLDVCGEVLVPAAALVDGAAVVRDAVDAVTYWHVELDSHDLLVAENMACESYLAMGNRGFFPGAGAGACGATDLAAAPDRGTRADFCRPFHEAGPVVEAIRARLARLRAAAPSAARQAA